MSSASSGTGLSCDSCLWSLLSSILSYFAVLCRIGMRFRRRTLALVVTRTDFILWSAVQVAIVMVIIIFPRGTDLLPEHEDGLARVELSVQVEVEHVKQTPHF